MFKQQLADIKHYNQEVTDRYRQIVVDNKQMEQRLKEETAKKVNKQLTKSKQTTYKK